MTPSPPPGRQPVSTNGAHGAGTPPAGNPLRNPYVGPRPLKAEDKLFGRDQEVLRLLELLIAQRIVLLYSPSGAGKTSLIRAGLVGALEKEDFDVLPIIRVKLQPDDTRGMPDESYNRYVLSTLLSLEGQAAQASPARKLAGMSLTAYLRKRVERLPGGSEFKVLVFDQFEEVLTAHPADQDAKRQFFAEVGEALREHGNYYALFSVREDYLAGLDPYRPKLPGGARTTFRLNLLTTEAARKAIEGPAADAAREAVEGPAREKKPDVEFAPGVADLLVKNLSRLRVPRADGDAGRKGTPYVEVVGPFVEPVQLQVVCWNLWEGVRPVKGTQITKDHLREFGDVDKALANYYGECLKAAREAIPEVDEGRLRAWIETRLITEQGTRNLVQQGRESTAEMPNEVIDVLVNKYLVRREDRAGWSWLELAHDRLITPIRSSNRAWNEDHLHPMQLAARAWARAGRPASLLLRGDDLAKAEEWAERPPRKPSDLETEFLERSRKHEEEEKKAANELRLRQAEERAEQERQKAQIARALAEEQARLAEESRQKEKIAHDLAKKAQRVFQLSLLIGGLVVVSLVALVLAYVSWTYSVEADKQRTAAEEAREKARQGKVRLMVASGAQLLEGDDLPGSLPWFAAALAEEERPRTPAGGRDPQRVRLGAAWRQLPRLTQLWHRAPAHAGAQFGPEASGS